MHSWFDAPKCLQIDFAPLCPGWTSPDLSLISRATRLGEIERLLVFDLPSVFFLQDVERIKGQLFALGRRLERCSVPSRACKRVVSVS